MKRIMGFVIPLLASAMLFGQSDPLVFWMRTMVPVKGKQSQLVKAVAKKTQKFNGEDSGDVIRTYQITNGPDEGAFVRSGLLGPWAQFDETSDQQQAGLDYWMKNVAPLVETNKGMQIWSTTPELLYNGTGNSGPAKFVALRYYNIKPFISLAEIAKKPIEISKAINEDSRYGWYRLETGGDRSTWVYAFAFDSFSELDEGNSGFWDAFEKYHGKGSVEKFFEEFGNTVQANPHARASTILRYRADMSTPE